MLSRIGVHFDVEIPRIAEERASGETISAYPERLARDKAAAGLESWRTHGGQGAAVALAADTIVVLDEEVLEKPRDRSDAQRMLRKLSGKEHRVITGVCVANEGEKRSRSVITSVRFTDLSNAALRWLVASGDGDDKAGAYAIQGLAGSFIDRIDGSFSNVIGLPLTETLQLLANAGLRMPWG